MRPMKDSGVEWLGEIPAHWKIGKVKHYYKLQTGFTPDTKKEEYYDDINGYDWVNISDIDDGKIITETKNKVSQLYIDKFSPNQIPAESLLYSFKLSVGQTAFAGKSLYSNEAIAAFLPSDNVNLHFLRYSAFMIVENAEVNVYNARILNRERINNAYIIFPPLDEQQRIATFLDGECARIDSVIEKTRASIVEYKKLKQAVITRAVTKGIRPAQTMKDSGLEWLGDIPADWDCCKLKYLISSLNSGISVTATDLIDEGYPVYGGGQQIGFFSQFNMEDTIVVGRVGAKCGCVTKVIGKAWATDNALIVTTDFPKDYLYYILVAAELNKLNTSNAQPLITSGKVLNYKVAVPPRAEQKEIAQYLDEKTAAIDLLIEKKNQLATELERLKKSLIFEYVTGKKAVPA